MPLSESLPSLVREQNNVVFTRSLTPLSCCAVPPHLHYQDRQCSMALGVGPTTLSQLPDQCPDPEFANNINTAINIYAEGADDFSDRGRRLHLAKEVVGGLSAGEARMQFVGYHGMSDLVQRSAQHFIASWRKLQGRSSKRSPGRMLQESACGSPGTEDASDVGNESSAAADDGETPSLDSISPTTVVDSVIGDLLYLFEFWASAFLCKVPPGADLGPCAGIMGGCSFLPTASCVTTCVVRVNLLGSGELSEACADEIIQDIEEFSRTVHGYAQAVLISPVLAIVVALLCFTCTCASHGGHVCLSFSLMCLWLLYAAMCSPFLYAYYWVDTALRYYYDGFVTNVLGNVPDYEYQKSTFSEVALGPGLRVGLAAVVFHLIAQAAFVVFPFNLAAVGRYRRNRREPSTVKVQPARGDGTIGTA